MEKEPGKIRVLHIDDKHNWGGGQNQLYQLFKNQIAGKRVIPALAVRKGTMLYSNTRGYKNVYCFSLVNELDPIAMFRIYLIIRRVKPDIIQCHTPHSLMAAYIVSRLFSKKPRLISMRRVDNPIKSLFKYKLASDRIVAISDKIRQVLLDSGVPQEKITVIKSAVDIEDVKKQSVQQLDSFNYLKKNGIINIGSLSSLYRHKGLDLLLRSFDMLLRTAENYHLFIAGTGDQKASLSELAKSLGISEKVTFMDFVDKPYGFIKFLDIIVFPSRNEGLGTTILDSLVIQTPVIASNAGGIPEIIEDRKGGLLFEAGNHIDLFSKLKELAESTALRETLKQSASLHIPEWTDINKNSMAYELLYEELLREGI